MSSSSRKKKGDETSGDGDWDEQQQQQQRARLVSGGGSRRTPRNNGLGAGSARSNGPLPPQEEVYQRAQDEAQRHREQRQQRRQQQQQHQHQQQQHQWQPHEPPVGMQDAEEDDDDDDKEATRGYRTHIVFESSQSSGSIDRIRVRDTQGNAYVRVPQHTVYLSPVAVKKEEPVGTQQQQHQQLPLSTSSGALGAAPAPSKRPGSTHMDNVAAQMSPYKKSRGEERSYERAVASRPAGRRPDSSTHGEQARENDMQRIVQGEEGREMKEEDFGEDQGGEEESEEERLATITSELQQEMDMREFDEEQAQLDERALREQWEREYGPPLAVCYTKEAMDAAEIERDIEEMERERFARDFAIAMSAEVEERDARAFAEHYDSDGQDVGGDEEAEDEEQRREMAEAMLQEQEDADRMRIRQSLREDEWFNSEALCDHEAHHHTPSTPQPFSSDEADNEGDADEMQSVADHSMELFTDDLDDQEEDDLDEPVSDGRGGNRYAAGPRDFVPSDEEEDDVRAMRHLSQGMERIHVQETSDEDDREPRAFGMQHYGESECSEVGDSQYQFAPIGLHPLRAKSEHLGRSHQVRPLTNANRAIFHGQTLQEGRTLAVSNSLLNKMQNLKVNQLGYSMWQQQLEQILPLRMCGDDHGAAYEEQLRRDELKLPPAVRKFVTETPGALLRVQDPQTSRVMDDLLRLRNSGNLEEMVATIGKVMAAERSRERRQQFGGSDAKPHRSFFDHPEDYASDEEPNAHEQYYDQLAAMEEDAYAGPPDYDDDPSDYLSSGAYAEYDEAAEESYSNGGGAAYHDDYDEFAYADDDDNDAHHSYTASARNDTQRRLNRLTQQILQFVDNYGGGTAAAAAAHHNDDVGESQQPPPPPEGAAEEAEFVNEAERIFKQHCDNINKAKSAIDRECRTLGAVHELLEEVEQLDEEGGMHTPLLEDDPDSEHEEDDGEQRGRHVVNAEDVGNRLAMLRREREAQSRRRLGADHAMDDDDMGDLDNQPGDDDDEYADGDDEEDGVDGMAEDIQGMAANAMLNQHEEGERASKKRAERGNTMFQALRRNRDGRQSPPAPNLENAVDNSHKISKKARFVRDIFLKASALVMDNYNLQERSMSAITTGLTRIIETCLSKDLTTEEGFPIKYFDAVKKRECEYTVTRPAVIKTHTKNIDNDDTETREAYDEARTLITARLKDMARASRKNMAANVNNAKDTSLAMACVYASSVSIQTIHLAFRTLEELLCDANFASTLVVMLKKLENSDRMTKEQLMSEVDHYTQLICIQMIGMTKADGENRYSPSSCLSTANRIFATLKLLAYVHPIFNMSRNSNSAHALCEKAVIRNRRQANSMNDSLSRTFESIPVTATMIAQKVAERGVDVTNLHALSLYALTLIVASTGMRPSSIVNYVNTEVTTSASDVYGLAEHWDKENKRLFANRVKEDPTFRTTYEKYYTKAGLRKRHVHPNTEGEVNEVIKRCEKKLTDHQYLLKWENVNIQIEECEQAGRDKMTLVLHYPYYKGMKSAGGRQVTLVNTYAATSENVVEVLIRFAVARGATEQSTLTEVYTERAFTIKDEFLQMPVFERVDNFANELDSLLPGVPNYSLCEAISRFLNNLFETPVGMLTARSLRRGFAIERVIAYRAKHPSASMDKITAHIRSFYQWDSNICKKYMGGSHRSPILNATEADVAEIAQREYHHIALYEEMREIGLESAIEIVTGKLYWTYALQYCTSLMNARDDETDETDDDEERQLDEGMDEDGRPQRQDFFTRLQNVPSQRTQCGGSSRDSSANSMRSGNSPSKRKTATENPRRTAAAAARGRSAEQMPHVFLQRTIYDNRIDQLEKLINATEDPKERARYKGQLSRAKKEYHEKRDALSKCKAPRLISFLESRIKTWNNLIEQVCSEAASKIHSDDDEEAMTDDELQVMRAASSEGIRNRLQSIVFEIAKRNNALVMLGDKRRKLLDYLMLTECDRDGDDESPDPFGALDAPDGASVDGMTAKRKERGVKPAAKKKSIKMGKYESYKRADEQWTIENATELVYGSFRMMRVQNAMLRIITENLRSSLEAYQTMKNTRFLTMEKYIYDALPSGHCLMQNSESYRHYMTKRRMLDSTRIRARNLGFDYRAFDALHLDRVRYVSVLPLRLTNGKTCPWLICQQHPMAVKSINSDLDFARHRSFFHATGEAKQKMRCQVGNCPKRGEEMTRRDWIFHNRWMHYNNWFECRHISNGKNDTAKTAACRKKKGGGAGESVAQQGPNAWVKMTKCHANPDAEHTCTRRAQLKLKTISARDCKLVFQRLTPLADLWSAQEVESVRDAARARAAGGADPADEDVLHHQCVLPEFAPDPAPGNDRNKRGAQQGDDPVPPPPGANSCLQFCMMGEEQRRRVGFKHAVYLRNTLPALCATTGCVFCVNCVNALDKIAKDGGVLASPPSN